MWVEDKFVLSFNKNPAKNHKNNSLYSFCSVFYAPYTRQGAFICLPQAQEVAECNPTIKRPNAWSFNCDVVIY